MAQHSKFFLNSSIGGLCSPTGNQQTFLAIFLAFAMVFCVGTALGFEHIGGYMPCALCLKERVPYYIGAPLMLVTVILSAKKDHGRALSVIIRSLFIVAALLMLYDCALSIYHAGAEYKFWPGPSDCSGGTLIIQDAGDILSSLEKIKPPSCDQAAGYFLGLSFAGWNVVATFLLAIIALIGAFIKKINE